MLKGAFSTLLSKGVVLVVNAISIPITVRYLGAESFGVFVTITTALSMLLVLDLGIANALTNFVSEAYAVDDREHASTYSTTALALLVACALLLGGLAWGIWSRLDWVHLFHLSSDTYGVTVGRAVAAALCVFLVALPASLGMKILGGYQELRLANVFTAAGSLASLLSIVVLVWIHAGLVALVFASSAAFVAANLLCLVWIWFFHKPWLSPRLHHLDRAAAGRMLQSGGEFFVLQLAYLFAFNSDNLVVTHYLGPASVTSYSMAWRLIGYAAIAQTLISPALWPAYSEAFKRGDLLWVRRTFRRTMTLSMGITLGFAALFALAGRALIRVWAGEAAVPTESLVLLMCIWAILSAFMSNTATLLFGRGKTRMQAWCSLAAAALNLWLSVVWVQRIGAPGVILATIASYSAVLVVPQTLTCYKVLKGRL